MTIQSQYKVSVCITTYNMQSYIARAVESVLMQKTNFDVEIIVSDDASTDDTIKILEEYKNRIGQKFTILSAQDNKGLIENFVKAVTYATGEYLATLDADDYWIDSHKLQKQVDTLDKNPDLGYIFSNYYNEVETTQKRTLGLPADYVLPGKNIFHSFLLSPTIQISTPCIRRSALDYKMLAVFVEQHFEAQDYPLFLSLSLAYKAAYIPDMTAVYTIRQGSMSNEFVFENKIRNQKRCFEIGDYFINRYAVPESLIKQRNFDFHLKLLLLAWESGDYNNVVEYVKPLCSEDFRRYNKKAWYIYYASKNKILYTLFRYWVLRKRR
jgi:glycosyltransferase involved in cell wall biosynthesis